MKHGKRYEHINTNPDSMRFKILHKCIQLIIVASNQNHSKYLGVIIDRRLKWNRRSEKLQKENLKNKLSYVLSLKLVP